MMFEQFYILIIYILFTELVIVTIVVVSLFVALVMAIRKLDNKAKQQKNTSLPLEMY